MTRKEAINDLKLSLRMWGRKPSKESYEMAIRSIEAWDKVIEDINKSLSVEKDIGIRIGYTIAEKILKDHLQEVEK